MKEEAGDANAAISGHPKRSLDLWYKRSDHKSKPRFGWSAGLPCYVFAYILMCALLKKIHIGAT